MISSKQNSLIKEIRSFKDKKFRDKQGVFIVEGIKPIKEAIKLGIAIREIVCTEKAFSQFTGCNLRVEVVEEEIFKYISEEKTPQGALAVAFKRENQLVAPNGSCLLLDGVSDPTNVGAIIRTAAASGYNDVYMTPTCADPYSQKSVRCSMSGIFHVNVMRAELDELLRVINLPICVADMDGENIFSIKKPSKVCLVIGNEGKGVSQVVKDKAQLTISIPMENDMESLNASVSAGILMYALKEF